MPTAPATRMSSSRCAARQVIRVLTGSVAVGRSPRSDIALEWDDGVS